MIFGYIYDQESLEYSQKLIFLILLVYYSFCELFTTVVCLQVLYEIIPYKNEIWIRKMRVKEVLASTTETTRFLLFIKVEHFLLEHMSLLALSSKDHQAWPQYQVIGNNIFQA